MNRLLLIIRITSLCGLLLVGCRAPQPPVEVSPSPTFQVTSQPSETPTVQPQITASPTARIKVTRTPIPNTKTYTGEWVEFGEGMIRTWIRTDEAGNPLAMGVQFTEEMLSGLPISLKRIPMALPPEISVPPFDHIEMDWRPQGHHPNEYQAPHFDFRFYIISEQDRKLIRDEHVDTIYTKPAPKYMPAFYAQVETTVRVDQYIGERFWNMNAPEANGEPFIQSFNFGFWHGHMVFLEPMMTLGFLETHPEVVSEIQQPQEFEESGFYPMMYRTEYNESSGEYNVSLEGFVQH